MPRPFVLAITGPTNSGKTYLSRQVMEAAKNAGMTSSNLSTDDFYRTFEKSTDGERVVVNYDAPDSIDGQMFAEAVRLLSSGVDVKVPVYDFTTHRRIERRRTVEAAELVIVEGIFALAFDEVLPHYSLTCYVEIEPETSVIRRIRRDSEERGRSLESVLDQFERTILPTQREYVMRDRYKADIIVRGDHDHSKLVELLIDGVARGR